MHVTLLLLVAAVAATAAAGGVDPAALARALAKSPINAADLPAGLVTPRVLRIPLSDNSKRHHAAGTIDVVFGEAASIVYDVFPTRADAVADYRAAEGHPGDTTATAPASFPKPSKIVSGTIVLPSGKAGISGVEFVAGNVVVLVATTSATSTRHGDVPKAIALARYALRHLAAVRGAA